MDSTQADEPGNLWLLTHCSEYGFILRYPADKEDVTGISYEPWHFRYVGKEAAQYIMDNGITLEDFKR
jgi:D-alanyl-D-alanine carboxypeptidase